MRVMNEMHAGDESDGSSYSTKRADGLLHQFWKIFVVLCSRNCSIRYVRTSFERSNYVRTMFGRSACRCAELSNEGPRTSVCRCAELSNGGRTSVRRCAEL